MDTGPYTHHTLLINRNIRSNFQANSNNTNQVKDGPVRDFEIRHLTFSLVIVKLHLKLVGLTNLPIQYHYSQNKEIINILKARGINLLYNIRRYLYKCCIQMQTPNHPAITMTFSCCY